MPSYTIAPSILSADFANLGTDAKRVLDAGADMLHFDVMDNHFVPNLTIGPDVAHALHRCIPEAIIDVHLMITSPDRIIPAFAKAGARCISIHPETTLHIDRTLALIKSCGCLAGLALNPATPLSVLQYVMDKVDVILIMSVNPGFGGQQFIQSSLRKITEAKQLIISSKKEIKIAVDGGITVDNIQTVASAGADTFIAGSAIFGSDDYKKTIDAMRAALAKANTEN